jgi:hypothetical protein
MCYGSTHKNRGRVVFLGTFTPLKILSGKRLTLSGLSSHAKKTHYKKQPPAYAGGRF